MQQDMEQVVGLLVPEPLADQAAAIGWI